MEKYQNKIQTIEYFLSDELLVQTWGKQSGDIGDADFIAEMLQLADYIAQTKPKRLLIDMRNFKFPVAPEQQDWINKNVNLLLAEFQTKTAFVVSPDLFTAVSVEQTLSEKEGKRLVKRFFDDYEKAKNWLRN